MARIRLNFEDHFSATIDTAEQIVECRKPGARVDFSFEEMKQILKLFGAVDDNPITFNVGGA